jgi:hypothetical protein
MWISGWFSRVLKAELPDAKDAKKRKRLER